MSRILVVISALVVCGLLAPSIMAEDGAQPVVSQPFDSAVVDSDAAVRENGQTAGQKVGTIVSDVLLDRSMREMAQDAIERRASVQRAMHEASRVIERGSVLPPEAVAEAMQIRKDGFRYLYGLGGKVDSVIRFGGKVTRFLNHPVVVFLEASIPAVAEAPGMREPQPPFRHRLGSQPYNPDVYVDPNELVRRRTQAVSPVGEPLASAALPQPSKQTRQSVASEQEKARVAAADARERVQREFDEVIRQAEESRRREAERKAQQARDFERALERMEQQRAAREAAAERARSAAETRAAARDAANEAIRERNAKRLERLWNGENVIRKAGDRL